MQRNLLFLTFIAGLIAPAYAQDRGTIEGTVTDATGSVVPAAKIRIVQVGTNASWNLEANAVGRYFAPNLPLGSYRVTAQKEGFNPTNSDILEVRSQ